MSSPHLVVPDAALPGLAAVPGGRQGDDHLRLEPAATLQGGGTKHARLQRPGLEVVRVR